MSSFNSILVLGPTASGKTKMAVKIALEMEGEIVSIDSRQVYKRLDIGTGKDLDENIRQGLHGLFRSNFFWLRVFDTYDEAINDEKKIAKF